MSGMHLPSVNDVGIKSVYANIYNIFIYIMQFLCIYLFTKNPLQCNRFYPLTLKTFNSDSNMDSQILH